MAIMYVFTINNPNFGTVENFPPSIMNSTWLENIHAYHMKNAISTGKAKVAIIFSTQQELENFISNYKLKDPVLISDLNVWKSAHGITYTTNYYNLSDSDISPLPDLIIS